MGEGELHYANFWHFYLSSEDDVGGFSQWCVTAISECETNLIDSSAKTVQTILHILIVSIELRYVINLKESCLVLQLSNKCKEEVVSMTLMFLLD